MYTDAKLFSISRIENGTIANQIHGFTIDYGKFILMELLFNFNTLNEFYNIFNPPCITHRKSKFVK